MLLQCHFLFYLFFLPLKKIFFNFLFCVGVWASQVEQQWEKKPACQSWRFKRCGFDPALGRSPGEGNANPLQYSCLENPMDRRAWRATVQRVSRVGHDSATKPPQISWLLIQLYQKLLQMLRF